MHFVLHVLCYEKQFYVHTRLFTECYNFWQNFNKYFSLISQYWPNFKFILLEMFVTYSISTCIQCIQVALHFWWWFLTRLVIYIFAARKEHFFSWSMFTQNSCLTVFNSDKSYQINQNIKWNYIKERGGNPNLFSYHINTYSCK